MNIEKANGHMNVFKVRRKLSQILDIFRKPLEGKKAGQANKQQSQALR